MLRAGLRALLTAEGDMQVVGEAANGREAIEACQRLKPDVVLMDITMPGMGGLEATVHIRKRCPEARVLMLTMHDNEEYLFRSLQAGASGYVLKKAADRELIGAIRSVSAGEAFLYPTAAKALIEDYVRRAEAGEEGVAVHYSGLSEREREVLSLIASGYTNQQIADRLVISVKTVETHRAHIIKKLGLSTRAELVRYAVRHGLMDPEI